MNQPNTASEIWPVIGSDDHQSRTPKVSVIVLNWNGKADTLECLESVESIDYPNFEIIVVDNGSEDDSVVAIRQRFPRVRVIETGKNLGYAGGNNAGISEGRKRGAAYVLLFNNDTIVDREILSAFLAAARDCPDAGMFGAKVYHYAEPNKIWYAGASWSEREIKFHHVGFGCEDNGEQFNSLEETDFAQGCAMFVRVETIDKIGLMDETFFLTYEEVDWCYRARKVGYKTIFVPKAKVWHKISASFGGEDSPLYNYFLLRNRLLWGSRHLTGLKRWLLWRVACLELISDFWLTVPKFYITQSEAGAVKQPYMKRLYWSFREFFNGFKKIRVTPTLIAKLCAIWDYMCGRFGPPARRLEQFNARRNEGTHPLA